jgi:hypothetical protein
MCVHLRTASNRSRQIKYARSIASLTSNAAIGSKSYDMQISYVQMHPTASLSPTQHQMLSYPSNIYLMLSSSNQVDNSAHYALFFHCMFPYHITRLPTRNETKIKPKKKTKHKIISHSPENALHFRNCCTMRFICSFRSRANHEQIMLLKHPTIL